VLPAVGGEFSGAAATISTITDTRTRTMMDEVTTAAIRLRSTVLSLLSGVAQQLETGHGTFGVTKGSTPSKDRRAKMSAPTSELTRVAG
jgi:hypothetical protein